MDWKTDADLNESEEQPYSSFQSNKSGRLFDRLELPIIFVGAGLLVLVILFVAFIPKKNQITVDDYKHIVLRLDQIEDRIDNLTDSETDVSEFDPAENPVQYQQLVNWIKSNAEVISETMKKVDAIEKDLSRVAAVKPAGITRVEAEKPVPRNQKPVMATKSPKNSPETSRPETFRPETSRPAVKKESMEKSKAVSIQTPVKPEPKIESKPVVSAPKPVVQPAPDTSGSGPEMVKLIFHRVEKGENLYRISRKYGTSVEKLQELNDMKKDDLLINVGQELIVRKEKQ